MVAWASETTSTSGANCVYNNNGASKVRCVWGVLQRQAADSQGRGRRTTASRRWAETCEEVCDDRSKATAGHLQGRMGMEY